MDVNGGSILIVSSWADMVVVLDPCFVGYSLRFSQKMVGFILLVIILQKEMSSYPHTIYKMFSATWFNVDQPHTIHGIQFISTWNPRHCGFYLDLCCWSAIVFLTGQPRQVFATTSRGRAAASSARPARSAEGKVWRPRQQWLRLGRDGRDGMGGCKHTKSYWK